MVAMTEFGGMGMLFNALAAVGLSVFMVAYNGVSKVLNMPAWTRFR